MQIFPTADLRPFIKHYLFIELFRFKENHIRIFADGNTGIVFCLGDGMLLQNGEKLPRVFAYGQIDNYKNLEVDGSVLLVVTVFRPYGMNGILGIPATVMNNIIVDFEAISGCDVNDLYEQLCEMHGKIGIVEKLDNYFTVSMENNNKPLQPMVSAATNWIFLRKGIFTAKELIEYTGCQQRTIERNFKTIVGMSPKKLAGIIRLHHFLGEIRNTTTTNSFTTLVYDTGYYDQAHLIHDFQKFVGLTPSAYHLKHYKLAVNVVDMPVENIQLQVEITK